ncbi:MAG: DUF4956 domain-containing protein [Planctomycetaceae bacterium]
MPEWLTGPVTAEPRLGLQQLLLRMVAALIFGMCVAGVFKLSHGRTHERSTTLATTLILLSLLIAMVSLVIGSSVALAFSLVGALSIVRFRTVVEDTRDTAFVIFAVVVGMAAGAGQLLIPIIGLPLVGATAIVLSRLLDTDESRSSVLMLRLGLGRNPNEMLPPLLSQYCHSFRLLSVATTKQGAAIEVSYLVRLKSAESMSQAVLELNRVDGIQGVELKSE